MPIIQNYIMKHFVKTLKKGNIIDIGSNVGSFSMVAAKYLASEKSKFKVYSFEPYGEIFNKLLKNIELNPQIKNNIILEKTALSNEKKSKTFFEIIPNNLGANYLKNEKNEKNLSDFVLSDTLDSYCQKHNLKNIFY